MGALKGEVFARVHDRRGGRRPQQVRARHGVAAEDRRRRPRLGGPEAAAAARGAGARGEADEDDRRRVAAQARGEGSLYDDLRRGEARAPAEFLVTFDDAGAAPAPVRVAEQESGGTRWAWGRGEAEAPPSMSGAELLDGAGGARRRTAPRTTTTRAALGHGRQTRPEDRSTGTRRAI